MRPRIEGCVGYFTRDDFRVRYCQVTGLISWDFLFWPTYIACTILGSKISSFFKNQHNDSDLSHSRMITAISFVIRTYYLPTVVYSTNSGLYFWSIFLEYIFELYFWSIFCILHKYTKNINFFILVLIFEKVRYFGAEDSTQIYLARYPKIQPKYNTKYNPKYRYIWTGIQKYSQNIIQNTDIFIQVSKI